MFTLEIADHAFCSQHPQVPVKREGQFWINHGYEQPAYFSVYDDPGYMDYIDINATYYLHSQVPVTFTCLWGGVGYDSKTKIPTSDVFLKPPKKKSKDKVVAFMSTNCQSGGATYRTEYVRELMKYIEVDSFGRCLHTRDMPAAMRAPIYSDHGASMRNKIGVFQNYKFVLTFENNNITDYVTEKLINVLQAGSVPVYMGSSNIDPYWVPGPKSIIRTDEFASPRELAEYLHYLNENDDAYMEYFAWKKTGLSKEFQERFDNCGFYGAECRLCQYILKQRNKMRQGLRDELAERKKTPRQPMGSIDLSGGGAFVMIPKSPELTSAFSVKMWIKLDEIPGSGIVLMQMGTGVELSLRRSEKSTRAFVELCVSGDDPLTSEARRECFRGSRGLVTNSWYQITVKWSYIDGPSGDCAFWVNGVSDAAVYTPSVSLSLPKVAEGGLSIGAALDGSRSLRGSLDDVQIFSRALEDDFCRKGVYSIAGEATEDLVGAWLFNDPASEEFARKARNSLAGKPDGEFRGKVTRTSLGTKPLQTANPCL
jgi:Glycosyltransferase family 10 (fucosyltransferase) C-term/Concanavalin A-like lectin/glucanases superfamily